ncbi:MAG: hypothetical protein JWN92_358 [Candidatus Acidoferrum typicum]|jgi:hypothetical protein|nr:hypothetical protein [Candidatus Acidoferrum typicum]
MMKKQTVVALVLLLLIPIVWILGGLLFSLINPEIAAGHANYVRNYHLLSLVKSMLALGSSGVVAILWLLACFLVIRSKERSSWWLFLAALGPLGFAILARLNDRASAETDPHARFVRSLNRFIRLGYEVCIFVVIWLLAYQAMVLKRNLMILYESATTGISTAQIINLQNASSGMWAFAEGMEVMYMVVLLYLIWPIVFNIVGRVAAIMASPETR